VSDLSVGPFYQVRVHGERLKQFCHGELPGYLEPGVPDPSAEAVGPLVDEDVTGDVDDLQLTFVQELQTLQLGERDVPFRTTS
jgi:hypothetical protein